MKIQLLYFPECPSYKEAALRVRKVLDDENIFADIELISINSEADVMKWYFFGSPTILIDGVDIDSETIKNQTPALTCRIYQWEDGRHSPLPSEQMIRSAVKKASESDV